MIDIKIGDCRQLIHELDNESVDCVMTSPPYWCLRDYKTDPIVFDGLPDCEHEFGDLINVTKEECCMQRCNDGKREGMAEKLKDVYVNQGAFCHKCGAWRGSLGLEPTPELYIKHVLDFFDDVKLKLKAEGNCFVNIGDTYYGSPSNSKDSNLGNAAALAEVGRVKRPSHEVLKSKSLCMVPQRFAWGMIERGWILRNEIIWYKPNHMPESVTDRLTKAHEVIYHLVKQQKYYYNLDAIREPHQEQSMGRYERAVKLGAMATKGKINERGKFIGYPEKAPKWFRDGANTGENNKEPYKQNNPHTMRLYQGKFDGNESPESFGSPRARTQRQTKPYSVRERNKEDINDLEKQNNPLGKNPGDVWDITTQPYPESHFAVFPLELVRRPILAGCPIGGTVLDPFGGSGTVGEFCRHNERNAILFELNPEYGKLIKRRSMANIPELGEYI